MLPYSFVLIIHVTAVFTLCAALSFEALSLFHLRSASTLAEARPWIDPVPRLPGFALGSLLVILFSGVYLVIQESAAGRAWPKVAVAALFLMAPFGKTTASRISAIRKAYLAGKVTSTEPLSRLHDPFLKISLSLRIAGFLGIFFLVSAKPGILGAMIVVGASMTVGLLASLLPWRRKTPLPIPSA